MRINNDNDADKAVASGGVTPYLFERNCSGRPLITDFGCLPFWTAEILVADIVESMKWSDSKQLAA